MEELFKWSKNGMKMLVKTDYALFNKQTNLITEGNCISNTQYSMNIRPYTETMCNGSKRKLGELQNFDLKGFNTYMMTDKFLNFIKSFKNDITLYEFFVWKKENEYDIDKTQNIIGWLVVDNKKIVKKELCSKYRLNRNIAKKQSVLDLCEKIINKDIEEIYNVK